MLSTDTKGVNYFLLNDCVNFLAENPENWYFRSMFLDKTHTVQITFIFIGQTHLVFGKRVCTCVTKHSNAFRTFLNWLKGGRIFFYVSHLHGPIKQGRSVEIK